MFKDEADFEKIVGRLNIDTKPNPVHRQSLGRQMLSVFSKTSQKHITPLGVFRRTIIESRITKLAAAAVIIIGVFIGIYKLGGSAPAFAQIVEPLLTARTAVFKFTSRIEGGPTETMDCMYMEPGRTREIRAGGIIRILDQHQRIMLYPAEKKAVIFKRINIPEDQQGQTAEQTGMFHGIREELRRAKDAKDESVIFLGKQQIDGVMAFKYRTGKEAYRTVWADAETLLPIRIEYSLGNNAGLLGIGKGTITYSGFVFNMELDESLFVVPEGYDVKTLEQDVSKNREEDLIQALRLWSEHTDGTFPTESELNMKAAGGLFERIKEKMGLASKEDEIPDFAKPQFSDFYPIRLKIIRGLGFTSSLCRSSESDWHYTTKDVKLGDADAAVCWYHPEESQTYRVIYGDLTVKDVARENLPK
ncbi:MAG: hypothetical protein JSW66_12395 [Phycisphaerales bacterium]|nr:MAG: hypothetical protein JSW66_12395 [Phycisphaerales bacterium]